MHARLFIPMRTKGMHVATIVLFLAASFCALQASNFPWLGWLAMLGLAAFVILILVSDILQLVKKPQAVQE